MSNTTIVISLAKVMVAAAWADGEITNEEINCLKDLLFHLPGMTAQDWAKIDIYIESPVEEAERLRLVEDLQARLSAPADKAEALRALDQMVLADGEVTESEQEVVNEIKAAIQNSKVGVTRTWGRFMNGRVKTRSEAVKDAPNREKDLDDFVKNKIYYDVSHELALKSLGTELSEDALRKLSLAGGLMARVAFVDRQVTDEEYQAILQALQQNWGISLEEAAVVAEAARSEISKGLDYYRLTRQFFECTSEVERVRFLDTLFAITVGDGRASNEEIEEIRTIANGLLLTHKQFIDAKLKVPGEQRAT